MPLHDQNSVRDRWLEDVVHRLMDEGIDKPSLICGPVQIRLAQVRAVFPCVAA